MKKTPSTTVTLEIFNMSDIEQPAFVFGSRDNCMTEGDQDPAFKTGPNIVITLEGVSAVKARRAFIETVRLRDLQMEYSSSQNYPHPAPFYIREQGDNGSKQLPVRPVYFRGPKQEDLYPILMKIPDLQIAPNRTFIFYVRPWEKITIRFKDSN